MRVLGVPTPAVRGLAREFRRRHPDLTAPELYRVAQRLWVGRTFDERVLAVALLELYSSGPGGMRWAVLNRWIGGASGWALCDAVAGGPLARALERDPGRIRDLLRWTRSPNPWRRRASLYALGRLVRSGRLDGPFSVVDRLLRDSDPWVQRAVGTWLREAGKVDPPRVRRYLLAQSPGLPRTVVTVATERSPAAFRSRLRRRNGFSAREPSRLRGRGGGGPAKPE